MATYGAQEAFRPYGSKCSSHTGQEVSLVCTNCDILVCVGCVASNEHKGHVFDDLDKVVRGETAKIQRIVNTNENTDLAKIGKGLSDVKKKMAKNKIKHNKISAVIMSRVRGIKKEADKQAKILLRDCNKNEKRNHDGLLKCQATLTNQQRDCEKQIKMFKKTLQSGGKIEVLDSRNTAKTFVLGAMHSLNLAVYQPRTSVSELVKQALGPLNVPVPQIMRGTKPLRYNEGAYEGADREQAGFSGFGKPKQKRQAESGGFGKPKQKRQAESGGFGKPKQKRRAQNQGGGDVGQNQGGGVFAQNQGDGDVAQNQGGGVFGTKPASGGFNFGTKPASGGFNFGQ